MNKKEASNDLPTKFKTSKLRNTSQVHPDHEKSLDQSQLKDTINGLNYENSLKELDRILSQLQTECVPIDELNEYYRQGLLYLQHCEALLNNVEERVRELDPKDIASWDEITP